MYKIAVCDTFHCNDGAQCAGKISSIKRTKTRQLTEQGILKENRKLLEQGGYQRFWKIQKAMPNIVATKRKHRRRQSYIPICFRISMSSSWHYK